MRFKSFAFLGFAVLSCAAIAACDALNPEKDDPTPTPEGSPSPTNTGTPVPTPVTTTVGDITTIDWGTIPLDAGASPHFNFTAPAGTIGIDFMALGAATDRDKIFGFFSITGPNGTVIDDTAGAPARQAFAQGAMSFAVPADDSAITAAAAGAWRFHVLASNDTTFLDSNPHVLVKIRTAPSGVPVGEIDVNLIVVEGVAGGLTAATACTPGNPVYDGLAYASGLYDANLSLTIGQLTCYDLSASSAWTDISGQDELSDLFETSAGLTDARVNLFIVDSFSNQLAFAAGVAGSVPIPMQVNGTTRSGVAIQYDVDVMSLGETIAHEMGHSLGLYHTTEFSAATNGFDPISDTATCPALGMSYSGNGCPDDVNVMFPQLDNSMAGFSAGQGTVLAAAVHVRRQGTTFAPTPKLIMPPAERLVWNGPPLRCVDGVVRPLW